MFHDDKRTFVSTKQHGRLGDSGTEARTAGKCRDNEKKKNAVSIRKEKKITEPWVIVPNFTTTIKLFLPLIQFRVETRFTSLTS